jgi:CheY-like chemotaxis protein
MSGVPKILVVDDLAANRLAIRAALRGVEATIVEAGNGFDALAITLEEEFALILLDVQMPEMDGFEVCERLSANPQTADTGAGSGESRRPGQGCLPRQRQPRIADAAQRRHRALGTGAATSSSDPRQREYLEKVSDAGQTLLAIINDLLDLTRIASRRDEVRSAAVQPAPDRARVLSVIGHRAAEKGLRLEAQIDERLPEGLVGDSLRIEQILLNLLNNSIKFTETGGIVVRILVEDTSTDAARQPAARGRGFGNRHE